jgi:hypothetical protein
VQKISSTFFYGKHEKASMKHEKDASKKDEACKHEKESY